MSKLSLIALQSTYPFIDIGSISDYDMDPISTNGYVLRKAINDNLLILKIIYTPY